MKKTFSLLVTATFLATSLFAEGQQAVIKKGSIEISDKETKASVKAPAYKGGTEANGSIDLYYGSSLTYTIPVKGKDQAALSKEIMKIVTFYKGKTVNWKKAVSVPPKKESDPMKFKTVAHNIKMPAKYTAELEGETSQVAFTYKTENKKKKVGASIIISAPGSLDEKKKFSAAEGAEKVTVIITPFDIYEN